MKKTFFLIFGLLLLTGSAPTVAKEMKGSGHEMSEAQMQMMKNFEAYSTPNDMHAKLAKMEGTWNAEARHWMAPDAPVEISQGTVESRLIFGGRFIEQRFSSEWMGQPFEGLGLFGYDNIQNEFQSIWLDSMSTGIMTSSGKLDADGSRVEEGNFSCPLTNSVRWNRSKTIFVDDDEFTYEMYMKDEKGEEFRSMLITYTREK